MTSARCPRRSVPASLLRALLAVLAAVVGLLALPGAAAAAPPATAFVRLAHLSPDTSNVDVYLASVGDPAVWFAVPGVGYGNVTEYRALPADSYTVSMRPAGAPADSPPVIATTLTIEPGAAYTVAGTGFHDALGLTVLDDELGMPAPGTARIRVINGAGTTPVVNLSIAGGPAIAEGVAFAQTTGYRTVPTGDWTIQAAAPGGGQPTSLPIDVAANAVYTVFLLDRDGRLDAQLHLDSAGTAAVPLGGVASGFGGTAGRNGLLLGGAGPVPGAASFAPAPPGVPPVPAPGIAAPLDAGAGRAPAPVALRIPAIGVDRALVSLAVDATGVLVPPTSPAEPGWFAGGAVPGEVGPAIIAGHVDSRSGPGVFYRLGDLRPGDEIEVERPDGVAVFRVSSTETVGKLEFPTQSVYGPVPVPELRLITCGGAFARAEGHYVANVIVRAGLVRAPDAPTPRP